MKSVPKIFFVLVINKFFQPLFSTKPAGKGTGLGLPYNSVNANGGELQVETKEE